MKLRIKKYKLSHKGHIYRKGDIVELDDLLADNLLTASKDSLEAVQDVPKPSNSNKSKNKPKASSKPESTEEPADDDFASLPDVDPQTAIIESSDKQ